MHACIHARSLQLCLSLCKPIGCIPPGSSVHGILQVRILEWVAVPSSRGSSQLRDLKSPALAGGFFTTSTTWEAYNVNWKIFLKNKISESSKKAKLECAANWQLFIKCLHCTWTSLVAQMVKNLPAMRETRVQSLGWEDSLEKVMATHSSILAWEIPWKEEPGGL